MRIYKLLCIAVLISFFTTGCGSSSENPAEIISCKDSCSDNADNNVADSDDLSNNENPIVNTNTGTGSSTATGTYNLDTQTNVLTINVTATNFHGCGPDERGIEYFTVTSLTETSMVWLDQDGDEFDELVWTRTDPVGNSIAGNWELNNNGYILAATLEQNGSFNIRSTSSCDNGNSQKSLQYITSFGNEKLNTGYYDAIDVSSDGRVFIHEGLVHAFSKDHNYSGTIIDATTNISGTKNNFVIDSQDRMHVYYANWGTMHHDIFSLDGTIISALSGTGNTHIMTDIDRDSSGNHYMIPVSGSGSEASGRSLFVRKTNQDFTERLDALEKNDLLHMLPGVPDQFDVSLNGIKVHHSGNILVCIDLDGDNVSLSQDGSGFTDAYWGIIYSDTSATDRAIAYVDLGGPVSEQAGPVAVNWNASGILTVTVT